MLTDQEYKDSYGNVKFPFLEIVLRWNYESKFILLRRKKWDEHDDNKKFTCTSGRNVCKLAKKKILEWIMEKLFGRDKWENNVAK